MKTNKFTLYYIRGFLEFLSQLTFFILILRFPKIHKYTAFYAIAIEKSLYKNPLWFTIAFYFAESQSQCNNFKKLTIQHQFVLLSLQNTKIRLFFIQLLESSSNSTQVFQTSILKYTYPQIQGFSSTSFEILILNAIIFENPQINIAWAYFW